MVSVYRGIPIGLSLSFSRLCGELNPVSAQSRNFQFHSLNSIARGPQGLPLYTQTR